MGGIFSGAAPPQHNLLVVGPDRAGKTTLLWWLGHVGRGGSHPTSAGQIGNPAEVLTTPRFVMTAWDLGTGARLGPLWRHYYPRADCVIFIVDAADAEMLHAVAKPELDKLLAEPLLAEVPLLVLANKQDLPAAVAPVAVQEALGLHALRRRDWHVEGCAATRVGTAGGDDGVRRGLEWCLSRPRRATPGAEQA